MMSEPYCDFCGKIMPGSEFGKLYLPGNSFYPGATVAYYCPNCAKGWVVQTIHDHQELLRKFVRILNGQIRDLEADKIIASTEKLINKQDRSINQT